MRRLTETADWAAGPGGGVEVRSRVIGAGGNAVVGVAGGGGGTRKPNKCRFLAAVVGCW